MPSDINADHENRSRALIFDMDGVIVDSERFWPDHQQRILDEAIEGDTPPTSRFTGVGIDDEYDYLVENYDVRVSRQEYFELYNREARDVYEKAPMMDSFDEVKEYVNERKSQELKTALCSSSLHSWIETVVERFGLSDTFDEVVSDEDISKEGKPAPHIYLHTASLLEVEPDHCVVVEDSEHGVESAKRAGMYCIGFASGSEMDLGSADEVVDGHAELLDSLDRIFES